MTDFILRSNDFLQVTLAPAIVPQLAAPVPLVGTGSTVIVVGMPICLEGDEIPPSVRVPLTYTAPPFVTPGMGTLSVTLLPTNKTAQTQNKKKILLLGGTFPAKFSVTTPATQPTPTGPVPDPVTTKPGTAKFITSNQTVKAG